MNIRRRKKERNTVSQFINIHERTDFLKLNEKKRKEKKRKEKKRKEKKRKEKKRKEKKIIIGFVSPVSSVG
jgi:hypothetical protein